MEILLYFLFIYLLFLALRPVFVWLMRKFLQHQARRFFNQAYYGRTADDTSSSSSRRSQGQDPARHRKKKKVFGRNDGEYVEFEEIKVSRDTSIEPGPDCVGEEQVTDAEWTDVK